MTPGSREEALAEVAARRAGNKPNVVDNALLPAGSPMYYYCRTCLVEVAVKPEGWWRDPPPPRHCRLCAPLVALGWLD